MLFVNFLVLKWFLITVIARWRNVMDENFDVFVIGGRYRPDALDTAGSA